MPITRKGVRFIMKKRIISALLCLITVLSLFTTAFATDNLPETDPEDADPQTGTLTIEKKVEGVTPAEKMLTTRKRGAQR
jgi:hypothetical protein